MIFCFINTGLIRYDLGSEHLYTWNNPYLIKCTLQTWSNGNKKDDFRRDSLKKTSWVGFVEVENPKEWILVRQKRNSQDSELDRNISVWELGGICIKQSKG